MSSDSGFSPKVIILAGGKGTRSENPSIPKILQHISPSETILDLHIRNLGNSKFKDLTFLLGHLNEQVVENLKAIEKLSNLKISWTIDTPTDNPVTILTKLLASESNPNQIFIVLLGDVLINSDLMRYSVELSKSSLKGVVLVHPNLHPLESDVFEFDHENKAKKLVMKGNLGSSARLSRAIAGVYLFKKSALELFNANESEVTKGIIEPLFNAGELEVINSVEYFQDTGTKSRLLKAQKDFQSGAFHKRGEKQKKAIFLELEEILAEYPDIRSNKDVTLNSPVDISSAISKANSKGIPVVLFSVLKKEEILLDQLKTLLMISKVEADLRKYNTIVDEFTFVPQSNYSQNVKCKCINLTDPGDCNICGLGFVNVARRHSLDLTSSIFIGGSEDLLKIATSFGIQLSKTRDMNNKLGDIGKLVSDAISRISG